MKKSLLALIVTGSLALAGCTSSGSSGGSTGGSVDTEAAPDRLPPTWHEPEDGVSVPDRLPPIWGAPDDSVTPDRNPPLWSGPDNSGNAPDRLPPTWHDPEEQPIWGGPETTYTFSDGMITDIDGNQYVIKDISWQGREFTAVDKDGNEFRVRQVNEGKYAGNYVVFTDGGYHVIGGDTISGGISNAMESPSLNLDRSAIREAVRSRLNH